MNSKLLIGLRLKKGETPIFPWDQDFDPTSLYIPTEKKNKLTPAMRQYWEIKSENLDKVIFFKVGKFYELYYEDA